MAVAESFVLTGSRVVLVTCAVLIICVPTDVPALTLTIKENESVLTAKADAFEQLISPVPLTAGVMQVQPAGGVIDWKVVLAGVVSESVVPDDMSGPEF